MNAKQLNFKVNITIVIVFIAFIVPSTGWTATYYVAKTGSNGNPGTEASPWLTIQKAATIAAAGDTVYVHFYDSDYTVEKGFYVEITIECEETTETIETDIILD